MTTQTLRTPHTGTTRRPRIPSRTHAGAAFWLVAVVFLIVMAFSTVPTPLWPLYQQENGASTVSVTLAFSAYALGVLVSLFFAGHISDWHGRRRILLPAVVLEIAAAVIFSVSAELPALLAARFLGGLGVGLLTATATAFALELHSHYRPGRTSRLADAVTTTANLGGLGAGPVIAGVLAATLPRPLTTVYLIFLVLLALAAIAIAFTPETVTRHERLYRPQRVVVPRAGRARYFLLAVGAFLAFSLFGLFTSLSPKILITTLGVTSTAVTGLVSGVVFAIAVIAQLVATHVTAARQLAIGLVTLAGGYALLLVTGLGGGLAVFLAGAAVGGAGAGLVFKASMVEARSLADASARGEVVAGMFLAAYLGMILPVLGLAVVADVAGLAAGLTGLSLVALVVIALTGWRLSRTLRRYPRTREVTMSELQLPDPIREFVEATNAGDTDRFVAAFTEDAYLNDWGREFQGHDGVRNWDRTDNIGKQSHFEVIEVAQGDGPDAWIITVDVTGNGFNGRSPLAFTIRDGRIAALRIS